MIDKSEYYHGAAMIRLLGDNRCRSIRRHEFGYVINDGIFIFIKYTTKGRTPWRFTYSQEEINCLNSVVASFSKIVVVFVCGGDGICALLLQELDKILGQKAGWVSAKRRHNESYEVAGPKMQLERKVPVQRWPLLAFEST